jgi:hypothetical protein
MVLECMGCGYKNISLIEHEVSKGTYVASIGLCLIGLIPCFMIPFCLDDC